MKLPVGSFIESLRRNGSRNFQIIKILFYPIQLCLLLIVVKFQGIKSQILVCDEFGGGIADIRI